MRSRHSLFKSSLVVSTPALILEGVFCIISAFYGFEILSYFLAAIFIVSLISRIWASLIADSLDARIDIPIREVFAGQHLNVSIDIANRSFLPALCVDIFMPLPKSMVLMPSCIRTPDSTEAFYLVNKDLSSELVGSMSCGRIRWYEKINVVVPMEARCRGVFSFAEWSLVTGDGFGLSESSVPISDAASVVVFPKIINVELSHFMKNLWNSDTGSRGVMPDFSVIRSTRDYQSTDNTKHINWRLVARALPLKVNTYEEILPKSIHILFDGESFSGPTPHPEDMEDAISVIASVLVGLDEHDMKSYLSICRSEGRYPLCITPEDGIKESLYALSSYSPLAPIKDDDNISVIRQSSLFDIDSIGRSNQRVGHFFYFSYDSKDVVSSLFSEIDESRVTVISSVDSGRPDMYHHMLLKQLKRGE